MPRQLPCPLRESRPTAEDSGTLSRRQLFDRELRAFISPDLLVIDDFALRKLSSQATSDFYDLLIERHTRSSTILTSNRSVEEWMAIFDEPLLGQSALDRFCHRAHQFVIDGESYRKRTAPGSAATLKTGRKTTA